MRTILFSFLLPFVSFCCMHLYFMFTAVSYQMFFHWCSFIGVCEINHLTCLLVFMQPLATESECSRCALPTLPSFGENGLLLPIVPCQWHELSVGKFSCDYWMTVLRVCVKAIAQHAKSTWNTLSLFATAVNIKYKCIQQKETNGDKNKIVRISKTNKKAWSSHGWVHDN